MASMHSRNLLRHVGKCPKYSNLNQAVHRHLHFPARIQPSNLRFTTACHPQTAYTNTSCRSLAIESSRAASFHTSAKKAILPAEPEVIDGTVNDPAPVPDPSPTHGSYHWAFERIVSVALVPLTIAPFAAGTLNPITDAILCATLLVHSHIGFQAIIIDYIPEHRLPKIRKLFWWGLRLATLSVGVGLYEFETNDVGLTEAIKRIWTA